jgi:hypothetical protein
VEAAGCTEADAIRIYDEFHKLERAAKKAVARAKKSSGSRQGNLKVRMCE